MFNGVKINIQKTKFKERMDENNITCKKEKNYCCQNKNKSVFK